ncbi:S8 family serine peptidase [Kineococcus gynurae]|uniref:S8 family serine peptidase n=1 Tax=Kineococcus gynurae TaxID=452979 RepID=A0ABV5LUC5_9ACTN
MRAERQDRGGTRGGARVRGAGRRGRVGLGGLTLGAALLATVGALPAHALEPVAVDVLRTDSGTPRISTVTVTGEAAADRLVDSLQSRGVAADVATTYRLSAVDPLLARATHLQTVRAPQAWGTTQGRGVVVAVLDSGVDATQPDLRGRVLAGANFADGPASDIGEHGTMVATVLAGGYDNGVGAAGVSPAVTVLPVRVCGSEECSSGAIANGIVWAADQGASVVNLSLGGPTTSRVVQEAVAYANRKGAVIVASAGNAGEDCRTAPDQNMCGNFVAYPASYPGVISVSAGDRDGVPVWAEHNSAVDLSAPGTSVVVGEPLMDGRYGYALADGTSFSAPMVSAAAALARAVAPRSTPDQVATWITSNAARQPNWPVGYGAGLLDVGATVAAASAATAASTQITRADGSVDFTRAGRTVNVRGAILARYRAAGGTTSSLGWPTSSEIPLRGGAFTTFENGSIYWSPTGGAQIVKGAIRNRWGFLGWERGWLGFPTGEERAVRGGLVQGFAGGLVYFSGATGAQAVRGAILDRYAASGWETGVLGFPTTSEVVVRGGAFTHFQGGSVYWSPAGGARIVRGAIRDAWAAQGWETGRLGFPRTEEYAVPGGVRQDFTGGSLTYTWATGRIG